MTKIRPTKRVSVAYFFTATALCATGAFSQSLPDDATADVESIPFTSSDLTTDASRPKAALPILNWTTPAHYDTGASPKIAIRNGFIVEVHKTRGLTGELWYHIGKLDRESGAVNWGPSRKLGSSGSWPAVALSSLPRGDVIFTWSSNTGSENLFYRVGTVNINGDVNQAINFNTSAAIYDTGYHGSISVNRQRVVTEAHEGGKFLYYRLGRLQNNFTIAWDSGAKGIRYDAGVDPQISINDSYQVVEVHGVRDEKLLHYIRASVHSDLINFDSDHPRYDNSALHPGVVLNDDGSVVEVHQSGSKAWYRTGELAANSAHVTWSAAGSLSRIVGLNPAVASDGSDVIAVFVDGDDLRYTVAKMP
jgi:hypothetical protein